MKQAAIITTTLGVALGTLCAAPALAGSTQSISAVQSHVEPLHSGDLVRLRSGGPLMIVKSVQGDQVTCSWGDQDGELQSGSFPIATLAAPIRLPPNEDPQ
jgi:uncharacterized protein YodC (DUF2158 family)